MSGNWQLLASVISTTIIVILLASSAPDKNPMLWASLVLMVGMAVAFFIRACNLARQMKNFMVRRLIRTVRFLRKLLRIPPTLRFLHLLAWAIGCLSPAATLVGRTALAHGCIVGFLILLFIAGIADIVQRGTMLLRLIWSELLGKLFSVSVGAILLCLALAKAKTWVHSVAHIDPKYLTESTAIFAAILLPIMYCIFGMALLCLLAVLQLFGLLVFASVSIFAEHVGPITGRSNYVRFKLLWYRLSTGKKPHEGIPPSRWATMLDDISIFSKPFATTAIIIAMAMGLHVVNSSLPQLQPYLSSAVVGLEYRKGSSCIGFGKAVGVVYMEDGNISVVTQDGKNYKFTVENCKFHADKTAS